MEYIFYGCDLKTDPFHTLFENAFSLFQILQSHCRLFVSNVTSANNNGVYCFFASRQ